MTLLAHERRGEQKLFWRSRELALFTFLLPILFLLLLGSVYGSDRLKNEGGIKASSYLLAGMLGYGAAAIGFTGLAIVVVIRREEGVLKRVRATPLQPWAYLAALLASFTVANAFFLPMSFISGAFWSPHSYPRFLEAIADVLPMTYFIRLVRDVTLRHAEIWNRPGAVGVVAAWGAVGAVAALRGFRWMPRER